MPGKIGILFLGDIIGRPGRSVLMRNLSSIIRKHEPSLIIANAENAAGGVGITKEVGKELLARIDVLTSGNHIWDKKEVLAYLEEEPRILRPQNYPPGNPGRGVFLFTDAKGRTMAVVNLQGRVFMEPIDCPFRTADGLLEEVKSRTPVVIVDFHAEATSEKQALAWHLDGRVSAVIGTHTHVATADEKILPLGTAYITDVGMVGSRDSVIGIRKDQAVARFLTSRPQRFEPAKGHLHLSYVYFEVDEDSGRAVSISRGSIVEDKGEE